MQTDAAAVNVTEIGNPAILRSKAETTESVKIEQTGKSRLAEKTAKPASDESEKVDSRKNVQDLQNSLSAHGIELKFSQDEKTKVLIVQMIDQKTGEALRQMPSKVSLSLQAELGKLQGLIFSKQV